MNPDLLLHAERARANAYAPFSKFAVGAALETEDGSVFTGCNVENASYGLTICAERIAVGAAIAAGHRSFRRIAISTESAPASPPCGACRQVLSEFAPGMQVHSQGGEHRMTWLLDELLPARFTFEPSGDTRENDESFNDQRMDV